MVKNVYDVVVVKQVVVGFVVGVNKLSVQEVEMIKEVVGEGIGEFIIIVYVQFVDLVKVVVEGVVVEDNKICVQVEDIVKEVVKGGVVEGFKECVI